MTKNNESENKTKEISKGEEHQVKTAKKQTVPKRLKKYRTDKGFTIYSLAERLGVNFSTVSYWENGKKYPRHEQILNLEEIFGKQYSDLFRDLTPEEIKDLESRH
jgi:transcriptional regulator with XRE-family HTH domain